MDQTIIYIRTSTEEQNPENQLQDCLSINKYGSYSLCREQQSAWSEKDRPGFATITEEIRRGRAKHLIVWDLDRLHRNRLKTVSFLKLCKACGCNVHSFRQQWLEEIYRIPPPWNEIVSDMLINVMGWTAEEESTKKSERVKLAIRQKNGITISRNGNRWGRKCLSSFKINQITAYHTDGLSIREIAQAVGCSVGSVHKTLSLSSIQKIPENECSKISQFSNNQGETENLILEVER